MADMETIKNTVLDILEDVTGDEIVKEDLNISLPEEDLIYSLGWIELLMDIEDKLGIVIGPTEYTREEMETPAKIIAVVQGRSEKE